MPDCTLTIKWLKRHIAEHHSKTIGSLFSADEEPLQDDLQIQAVDDGSCFAMEEIPEVFVSESPYGLSCTDSHFKEFLSNTTIKRFKRSIVLSLQKIMRFCTGLMFSTVLTLQAMGSSTLPSAAPCKSVACSDILNEWPIVILVDTHMLCLQELSLNGVLLHTLKEERAGLLLVILEVTRDQCLVSLDISGNGLAFEEASLVAAFLHSNR